MSSRELVFPPLPLRYQIHRKIDHLVNRFVKKIGFLPQLFPMLLCAVPIFSFESGSEDTFDETEMLLAVLRYFRRILLFFLGSISSWMIKRARKSASRRASSPR